MADKRTNNRGRDPRDSKQGMNKMKKPKTKTQKVFIKLSENIGPDANLKGFLLHRMAPKVIPFEIVQTPTKLHNDNDDDGTSRVVLVFESKAAANRAAHLLHKSNKNTTSKIHCFFTSEEEKEQKVISKEKMEARFRQHMTEIVQAAKSALDRHDIKIREANDDLKRTEETLVDVNNPRLSFKEFEMLSKARDAREDKLNELKLQRKEFQSFLMSMKTRCEELKVDPNFETKIKEIRKYLGVECNRLKCALPMYARRADILDLVKNHQVSVILGETGSGKSTQMVQYLYQAGLADRGLIACTQPRKIAAVSLATHVASEMASCVGQVVGYRVGMQTRKTAVTKILYLTDHVLLNECLKDNNLSDYSCLIIDEAHERSIYTDLLLGMIKACVKTRPDLKVIVTSATINPDVFVSFFGGPDVCPVLQVSGRTFPVTVFYMDEDDQQPFPENHEDKAVSKAVRVHTECAVTEGDILVFLTSPLETEKCCEKFQACVSTKDFKCMQLHGKLQPDEQKAVFLPTAPGTRKIVFATNSAETSITIPGIKFVVDTGLAKEMRYDPKKNINSLSIYPVSKSSAEQRKGRAGRMAPGTCYRLFSEKDFNEMESNTKPEILRIHLGQALLKLLELGVNPIEFDFVESPPRDSLEIAMGNLQEIQAVTDGCITELGKWIAKLPLEPRLGVLVKNGLDKGVPVEAMVLAACCTSSGIFFRMGTDKEKKAADVSKTKFCHTGGDLLTMLNVFREWHQVNEKSKGNWCKENSINGKSMKGVRETINEILNILRKETKEDVKFSLKPGDEIDVLLQSLVIDCMKSNVCCFLGHEQAGYITGKQLQHVQIHPSSSLKSLGQIPKLLVYWQLLQTSRTFITNLTPINEELLQQSNLELSLDLDEERIKKQCVSLVGRIPVGIYVFRKFVGPMHKNRRDKEERFKVKCDNTIVIIDANRELGEIQLFCNSRYSQLAFTDLEMEVNNIAEPLKLQTVEVHLGRAKPESGIRAVIGAGGSVQDILMPYQFRTVKIKTDGNDSSLTTPDLLDSLSAYGQIEDIFQFKVSGKIPKAFWGKATYCRQEDACKAVQAMKQDQESDIVLVPEAFGGDKKRTTNFTLKLSWIRRSSRGIGYVTPNHPEDMPALLTRSTLRVNNMFVSMSLSKRGNLFLKGFPYDITEEAVAKALADAIGVEPDRSRFQVILPREPVDTTVDAQQVIKTSLQQYVPEDSFKLTLKDVKPATARGMAFVTFTCPDNFQIAANRLTQGSNIFLYGNPVTVTVDLKSSVYVAKNVFEAVQDDIQSFVAEVANNIPNANIAVKTLQSGNVVVDISASSTGDMASAKAGIHKVLDGDCLDCGTNEAITKLFTRDARECLKIIEREEKVVIFVDDRTMTVRIQGLSENRTRSLTRINEYLGKMANATEKLVMLKGANIPAGLMKGLIIKYGTDLRQLKTESGLLSIVLKHRYHSITLAGESSAIEKATLMIEEVKNALPTNNLTQGDDAVPECPICLCEIEQTELVRLEYCGHAYCQSCLKLNYQSALQEKQFPMICSVDNCNKPFVQKDIRLQIEKGVVKMKPLAAAAVSSFVGKNKEDFRYCITPDCEMVYRVSGDGRQFECSDCGVRTCTSCHIQYHDGLTCEMYQSAKTGEGNVELWIKDNPTARKRCPKCHVGIEKISGCDHMTCSACKSHICWKCLAYFSSGTECYGHLSKAHG